MLVFAFGYVLELALAKRRAQVCSHQFSKTRLTIYAMVILAAIMISGRTLSLICIAWLVLRLSPIIFNSPKTAIGFLILFLFAVQALNTEQLILALEAKLNPASEIGGRRVNQLMEGVDLISEAPLFGKGVGHAFDSVNGDWRIEVTPITLLVSHGIMVFFLVGVIFLLLLMLLSRRYSLNNYALPPILFLIVSSTNPILLKFDYIWIFILPWVMYAMASSNRHRGRECP